MSGLKVLQRALGPACFRLCSSKLTIGGHIWAVSGKTMMECAARMGMGGACVFSRHPQTCGHCWCWFMSCINQVLPCQWPSQVLPRQCPPAMATEQAFLEKLHQRAATGCCQHGCLAALQSSQESILRYRQVFRRLPKDVQDRDFLWVFGGGTDESLPATHEFPKGIEEHTSPSSSSHQGQPMEQTSDSGSEGEHVAQPSPESVAESSAHAREEHTSASDSDVAKQQQCATSASDAEARREVTSSSSEMVPLVSEEDEHLEIAHS